MQNRIAGFGGREGRTRAGASSFRAVGALGFTSAGGVLGAGGGRIDTPLRSTMDS